MKSPDAAFLLLGLLAAAAVPAATATVAVQPVGSCKPQTSGGARLAAASEGEAPLPQLTRKPSPPPQHQAIRTRLAWPCDATMLARHIARKCSTNVANAPCCEPVLAAVNAGGNAHCICTVLQTEYMQTSELNSSGVFNIYILCGGRGNISADSCEHADPARSPPTVTPSGIPSPFTSKDSYTGPSPHVPRSRAAESPPPSVTDQTVAQAVIIIVLSAVLVGCLILIGAVGVAVYCFFCGKMIETIDFELSSPSSSGSSPMELGPPSPLPAVELSELPSPQPAIELQPWEEVQVSIPDHQPSLSEDRPPSSSQEPPSASEDHPEAPLLSSKEQELGRRQIKPSTLVYGDKWVNY